jgi:hypothetical protein
MSTSELCVLVHCTQRSAQELLAKLKRKGLVYRSGWRRLPSGIAAVFRAGVGTDAIKPPRATEQERKKRQRAKETQEDKEFRLAREKAKKIKPRRDPMTAAFFGEYKPLNQIASSSTSSSSTSSQSYQSSDSSSYQYQTSFSTSSQ